MKNFLICFLIIFLASCSAEKKSSQNNQKEIIYKEESIIGLWTYEDENSCFSSFNFYEDNTYYGSSFEKIFTGTYYFQEKINENSNSHELILYPLDDNILLDCYDNSYDSTQMNLIKIKCEFENPDYMICKHPLVDLGSFQR